MAVEQRHVNRQQEQEAKSSHLELQPWRWERNLQTGLKFSGSILSHARLQHAPPQKNRTAPPARTGVIKCLKLLGQFTRALANSRQASEWQLPACILPKFFVTTDRKYWGFGHYWGDGVTQLKCHRQSLLSRELLGRDLCWRINQATTQRTDTVQKEWELCN